MPSNIKESLYEELNLGSKRCCKVYMIIINRGGGDQLQDFRPKDIIDYVSKSYGSKGEIVKSLIDQRESIMLPEKEFDLIEKDPRFCLFVWSVLKMAITSGSIFNLRASGLGNVVNKYSMSMRGVFLGSFEYKATESFFDEIVSFFDNWQAGILQKIDFLKSVKDYWRATYCNRLKLEWLKENNKEQCDWAWEYVKSKNEFSVHFHPINHVEMYRFVFAVLDAWDVENSAKELFVQKFKKAWDQKEYRKKQDGRSPLNTYISSESKKQLDSLAEKREEKIYQTLERIIRKAYNESR